MQFFNVALLIHFFVVQAVAALNYFLNLIMQRLKKVFHSRSLPLLYCCCYIQYLHELKTKNERNSQVAKGGRLAMYNCGTLKVARWLMKIFFVFPTRRSHKLIIASSKR